MIIRNGHLDDLSELQQLFTGTIREVCKADYTNEEIKVWVSGVGNKQRWIKMLANQFVLVAQDGDKIVGFCTLDKKNHIDFLYVHKDYQRQGIAYGLYKGIEKEAIKHGQTKLTSDVSKTARTFFEKIGFRIKVEQVVEMQGIKLINYKLIKEIT